MLASVGSVCYVLHTLDASVVEVLWRWVCTITTSLRRYKQPFRGCYITSELVARGIVLVDDVGSRSQPTVILPSRIIDTTPSMQEQCSFKGESPPAQLAHKTATALPAPPLPSHFPPHPT